MFELYDWTKVSRRRNDLTRSYEPVQIDILRSLARTQSDCIFLDVGANIGAYALLVGGDESVNEAFAFEPVPTLADELVKNIEINNLSGKITVRRVVLSDSSGATDFIIKSKYAGDGGVVETHLFKDLPFDRIEKFKKSTLDAEVPLEGKHVVAKIDVEGHELKVLLGAKNLLLRNKGFLQIEFLTHQQELDGRTFLAEFGWEQLFKIDRDVYFTNYPQFRDAVNKLDLLELCMAQFVHRTRNSEGAPSRKRVSSNIVLELTGVPARYARRAWKSIRRVF